MSRITLCAAVALALASAGPVFSAGDAAKGEQLHRACLGCHATELYVPPLAKVRNTSTLRKEVVRWNDRMNPKFTKKEIDDLVAYLNAAFYRFPAN